MRFLFLVDSALNADLSIREWAVRCVLESMRYENNYFLTLTYNDDHLPAAVHRVVDEETGEVVVDEITHPLAPDHLTQFMKNFRQAMFRATGCTGIRFFACGEYGDKYLRPHFHVILFNCNFPEGDLVVSGKNFRNDLFFIQKLLIRFGIKDLLFLVSFLMMLLVMLHVIV